MASLSRIIRDEAARLGFSGAGFAKAGRLEVEDGRFREWLDRGYHATMEWMADDPHRRTDLRAVLPGARSVVVVAMNYYTGEPMNHPHPVGAIARYAWGDDYHDVMGDRLGSLFRTIRDFDPTVAGKIYVDTGPVMEKAWAVRAGIGWQGKHTNIITGHSGSWVCLGVLLLTSELEYDEPATDQCGSCTLCIEACPTGAIVGPYVLDANRCISYLTIEHRGPLPGEFKDDLQGWIFGCDICQEVCPWNIRDAVDTREPAFQPRGITADPDLRRLAKITPEEFRELFRGSPVKRAKPAGLLRNVQSVLDQLTRHQENEHESAS